MFLDTKLSIHNLFFSKLIAPENYQPAAPTITSEAKHSLFPWYSLTPTRSSLFSWRSPSRTSDSRIHKFKYILEHGPCDFSSHSYYNTHGFNLGNKWRSKKKFGRKFFSFSKLASYRHSIVRLFDSKKLRNYPTPKTLCNLKKKIISFHLHQLL